MDGFQVSCMYLTNAWLPFRLELIWMSIDLMIVDSYVYMWRPKFRSWEHISLLILYQILCIMGGFQATYRRLIGAPLPFRLHFIWVRTDLIILGNCWSGDQIFESHEYPLPPGTHSISAMMHQSQATYTHLISARFPYRWVGGGF